MRPIPAVARYQCGVFSTFQAFNAGWSRSALHHAVRAGVLRQPRVGAYQLADLSLVGVSDRYEEARWLHAGAAVAAVLTTYGSAASHSTAAVLRGMPLIHLPRTPCITVLPWHTGEVPRVHLHRCTRSSTMSRVGGVNCLSAERTALDLAREHGAAAGVVALDYLMHQGLTSDAAVDEELAQLTRWPGVRAAREAVSLADGRSESVLETRSRLKLATSGLPRPEPQVRIGNAWGGFVARVDFYWDAFGVVGEADGAQKYDGTEPDSLLNEKKRQSLLEDLDLEVVRWGTPELGTFSSVERRLNRAFARGTRRGADRQWTILPPL
ncbi:MAG TPA: type IV toxin-antitoxin system AbiEi family antitoxin domain-containing protein [Jatrophihabitantaceae bacterium]|nr:type IV toxin-antitoxin system AbiEi family antitoxin domain-containing protein [Jatrophihabitantaceae bacterium]